MKLSKFREFIPGPHCRRGHCGVNFNVNTHTHTRNSRSVLNVDSRRFRMPKNDQTSCYMWTSSWPLGVDLELPCSYSNVCFSPTMCVFDVELKLTHSWGFGGKHGPGINPTGYCCIITVLNSQERKQKRHVMVLLVIACFRSLDRLHAHEIFLKKSSCSQTCLSITLCSPPTSVGFEDCLLIVIF